MDNGNGAIFEILVGRVDQNSIIFGRVQSQPVQVDDSESEDRRLLQFYYYELKSCRMMARMEYDLVQ